MNSSTEHFMVITAGWFYFFLVFLAFFGLRVFFFRLNRTTNAFELFLMLDFVQCGTRLSIEFNCIDCMHVWRRQRRRWWRRRIFIFLFKWFSFFFFFCTNIIKSLQLHLNVQVGAPGTVYTVHRYLMSNVIDIPAWMQQAQDNCNFDLISRHPIDNRRPSLCHCVVNLNLSVWNEMKGQHSTTSTHTHTWNDGKRKTMLGMRCPRLRYTFRVHKAETERNRILWCDDQRCDRMNRDAEKRLKI